MVNEIVQFDAFQNEDLNKAASQIISNDQQMKRHIESARSEYKKAILCRWKNGKVLYENYDVIMDELGSQRAFADEIGKTEAQVSNDLRGFKALLGRGCKTEQDVLGLLSDKGIKPSTRNWEKLPRLLENPDEKDARPSAEKKLEDIEGELQKIKSEAFNANQNHVHEKAELTLRETQDLKKHIHNDNPFRAEWKNRDYIDWCKNLGRDMLTGQPAEKLDFHHTDPEGASGGVGGKAPDYLGFPCTRDTHNKLERGELKPSKEELLEAILKTVTLFVKHHFKN